MSEILELTKNLVIQRNQTVGRSYVWNAFHSGTTRKGNIREYKIESRTHQRKSTKNWAKSYRRQNSLRRYLTLKSWTCIIFKIFFEFTAVKYNGEYLYEDLFEKCEFAARQNESAIETEESFLLQHHGRFDESRNLTLTSSRILPNDSKIECDADETQSMYWTSSHFVEKLSPRS